MGKTYKKNQSYFPKVKGRVFTKDNQPWKKNKHKDVRPVKTQSTNPSDYQ